MDIVFKICKYDACGLSITGLEKEEQQYSDEMTVDTFRYIDTVSINILIPVNKNNEDELPYNNYEIIEHTQEEDKSLFVFPKDGLFKIVRIIMPTKEWYITYNEKFGESTEDIYYYDNGKFYISTGKELTLEQITEVKSFTVNKGIQYTFNICNTEKCFYAFSQDYLNNICSDKCNISTNTQDRDLVFMTIYILKYLIDLGRYFEAQELIEKIHGCTGICKQINEVTLNREDCGC